MARQSHFICDYCGKEADWPGTNGACGFKLMTDVDGNLCDTFCSDICIARNAVRVLKSLNYSAEHAKIFLANNVRKQYELDEDFELLQDAPEAVLTGGN